jgi:hypothetical protein
MGTVSGTLQLPPGTPAQNTLARIELRYCGGNAGRVVNSDGSITIVSFVPFDVRTTNGVWQTNLYGSDVIWCGTVQGGSRWRITPIFNGVSGPSIDYQVQSCGGSPSPCVVFDIDGAPQCSEGLTTNCVVQYPYPIPPPPPTGSGVVSAGQGTQIAYYPTTGTTVAGDPSFTDDGATLNYLHDTYVNGNSTVDKLLYIHGSYLLDTPYAGSPMLPSFSGRSSLGVSNDGNFYVSVNGSTPSEVCTPGNGACGTGGGGAVSFAGDLSGTNTSQTVIGVSGHILPSLASGYLHWNGTAWVFDTPAGGGGGGVSGSGSTGFVPVWTASTTLGNSSISAGANQIQLGTPNPLGGDPAVRTVMNQSATANCSGNTTLPLTINPGITGCAGEQILFNNNAATSSGLNAGLFVNSGASNVSAGTLGIGVYGTVHAGLAETEERGGYFEAAESINTTVTTRRGLMGAAVNETGNTTTLNEGVVAQTMTQSGSTNTNDYSIHCLAPVNSGTMTNHACVKVDAQGTGVELQTGAHVFSQLPACSSPYEGSIASITDSATSINGATITGAGTNHVSAYCNGVNWVVTSGINTAGGIQYDATTVLTVDSGTLAASTDYNWISAAITMPASGCPCRVFLSYGMFYVTNNSGVFVAWVTDTVNNANYATSQGNQTGSAASGAGLSASGYTGFTYPNNATVTFAAKTWTTSGSMIVKAGNAKGPPTQNSWLNVMVIPSQ